MPARPEVAACGLDCSNCDECRATQSRDLAALELARVKWGHKSLAAALCDGCKGGGRITESCSSCSVRACASGRGLATCAACPDYACDSLERFLTRTPDARRTLEGLRGG